MLSISCQQHEPMMRLAKTNNKESFCNSTCSHPSLLSQWLPLGDRKKAKNTFKGPKDRHKLALSNPFTIFWRWILQTPSFQSPYLEPTFTLFHLCLNLSKSHIDPQENIEHKELQNISNLIVLAFRIIIHLCCCHKIESIFWKVEKWYQRFVIQRAISVTAMKKCLHERDVLHLWCQW